MPAAPSFPPLAQAFPGAPQSLSDPHLSLPGWAGTLADIVAGVPTSSCLILVQTFSFFTAVSLAFLQLPCNVNTDPRADWIHGAKPTPPSCYVLPSWHELTEVCDAVSPLLPEASFGRISHGEGESWLTEGGHWVSHLEGSWVTPFEPSLQNYSTPQFTAAFSSPDSKSNSAPWDREGTKISNPKLNAGNFDKIVIGAFN